MKKLTKRQREGLLELHTEGFVDHKTGFGSSQSNRQFWTLMDLGLADFGWGPKDSWLQIQGYLPVWVDPVC